MLVGLHVQTPFHNRIQFRGIHLEELAVVGELAFGLPDFENDVQSLGRAVPWVNPRICAHAKQRQVGGNSPVADAPVDAPSGQVVQHCDAVGHFHGVMDRQQGNARCQLDLIGHSQGLGNQQVRAGSIFPALGDVLADPGLVVAQPVRLHNQRQIPIIGVCIGPVRRVQGHHE